MNWAFFLLSLIGLSLAQTGPLPFGNFVPLNIEVVSHYPDTAFVSQRFLPFQVRGAEGIQLQSVRITRGDSCIGIVDPFYPDTGHIRCQQPEVAVAEVVFRTRSEENQIVILGPFLIRQEGAPAGEPEGANP